MNQQQKITLLKRKFQSLGYIEDFIKNYRNFVQTGLDAFEVYQKYRKTHPDFSPNKTLLIEEDFWADRVIPNFERMLSSSKSTWQRIKNEEKDCFDYLDGLAGDFRGLSRGFDSIREEFMDVHTPEQRKHYLNLFKKTSSQATIIESTINDWWDEDEILNERITGPIDEKELLNYLEPDESVE